MGANTWYLENVCQKDDEGKYIGKITTISVFVELKDFIYKGKLEWYDHNRIDLSSSSHKDTEEFRFLKYSPEYNL